MVLFMCLSLLAVVIFPFVVFDSVLNGVVCFVLCYVVCVCVVCDLCCFRVVCVALFFFPMRSLIYVLFSCCGCYVVCVCVV